MINSVDGVELIGVNYGRAQVKATDAAVQSLQAKLGDWLHVEQTADRDLA
jgi:hypothetical protein